MPLTVLDLFDFEDLNKHRSLEEDNPVLVENLKQSLGEPVEWNNNELPSSGGVYVVSLSDKSDKNNNLKKSISICETKIKNEWLKNAPYMTIDGKRATKENIKTFLSEFWLPKENILYIGATKNLSRRVKEYFNHELGKEYHHSGGQWLHAISICSQTFVYFVETKNYKQSKILLLQNFDFHVRKEGNDSEYVLPFANLVMKKENGKMYNKNKINGQIRMENQR